MNWKKKDYNVGHGKPPVSGQFRKGKSGNPKGRPKGTRNFKTDVEAVLAAQVTVIENGKPVKVSSQLATLMRLREKALKGDPRAMDRLIGLAQQIGADQEAAGSEQSLSAEEEAILQRYVDDVGRPFGDDDLDEEGTINE